MQDDTIQHEAAGIPPHAPSQKYTPWQWLGLAGPLVLSLSMGISFLYFLLFTVGAAGEPPDPATLSANGRRLLNPDRDMAAFVLGCALMLGLALSWLTGWHARLRRLPADVRTGAALIHGSIQFGAACVGLVELAHIYQKIRTAMVSAEAQWHDALSILAPLGMACGFSLVLAVLGLWLDRPLVRFLTRFFRGFRHAFRWLPKGWGWDAAIAGLTASLLITPAPGILVHSTNWTERLWHWHHFLFAPAVALAGGKSLGFDFIAPYSLGWPVLMVALDPILPLSVNGAMLIATLYSALYYVGFYILFRVAGGNRAWGLAAVTCLMYWQCFHPIWDAYSLPSIFKWPSLTPMRSPMDVWTLLCLAVFARTRRGIWIALAGTLAGLGLFMETDSGLVLVAAYMLFGMALVTYALYAKWEQGWAGLLMWFVLGLAGAGMVLLGGAYAAAGEEALAHPLRFFSAWLFPVLEVAQKGVLAVPYLNVKDASTPLALYGLCALFIGTIAVTVYRGLHRWAKPIDLFALTVALFGLGRMTVFCGRTIGFYLVLALGPAVLLAGLLISWYARWARRQEPAPGFIAQVGGTFGGWGLPVFFLVALQIYASPLFERYPNVWNLGGPAFDAKSSVISSGPAHFEEALPELRHMGFTPELVRRVRTLHQEGNRVGVASQFGTYLLLVTGGSQWNHLPEPFYYTWTREQLERQIQAIRGEGPGFYVWETKPYHGYLAPMHRALHEAIEDHYEKLGEFGSYTLYERNTRAGRRNPYRSM